MQPGCVVPQSFEAVELALVSDENVDHEVDVIHQDPLAMGPPFNVFRFPSADPEQFFLDGVGYGDDLPVRGSMADDKMIGHVAETFEVEDAEILSLLIRCGVNAGGQFRCQGCASLRYS